MIDYTKDPRFEGIVPVENRVWLSSPTMHGVGMKWINEALKNKLRNTYSVLLSKI